MTDREVLEALLRGEKIRNKVWEDGVYIYLDKDGIRYSNGIYSSCPTIFAEHAEIYKGPVKKYSFREAVNMIYEGKIMVSSIYSEIKYRLKDNKIFCFAGSEDLNDMGFSYDEINSNEWTEYKV